LHPIDISPSDNLLELLMLLDASKRASAGYIIAVMPYFGFARQDRKDKPRVAIGAKLISQPVDSSRCSKYHDHGFTCTTDSGIF
jgi:ribose-phosphate pyrophosphokinase